MFTDKMFTDKMFTDKMFNDKMFTTKCSRQNVHDKMFTIATFKFSLVLNDKIFCVSQNERK